MIVTIDGPAGAGKSSVAKALAQRLGFQYLDTGAMYRAVTLAGMEANCNLDDPDAVNRLLDSISIDLPSGKVILNGKDISAEIRAPSVTAASGKVASNPKIRERMVQLQRQIAAGKNMICDGRDQGTIVFPDAACKFFLSADPKERARRRYEELRARGETITLEEVLAAQEERDRRDEQRHIAPMKPATDALLVDSTGLDLNQVVDLLEREVCKCQG